MVVGRPQWHENSSASPPARRASVGRRTEPDPPSRGMRMSAVVVRYRVKPGRTEENAELVRAVYARARGTHAARASAMRPIVLEDGVTFVHVAVPRTDGHERRSPSLPAFQRFQRGPRRALRRGTAGDASRGVHWVIQDLIPSSRARSGLALYPHGGILGRRRGRFRPQRPGGRRRVGPGRRGCGCSRRPTPSAAASARRS